MRGWDCVAQVPGMYPRRIVKSTRQADHWNEFLTDLDHGRDNIFDFIYGVNDEKTERPVKQIHIPQANQITESDDPYSPATPTTYPDSGIKDSCGGLPPNDDPGANQQDLQSNFPTPMSSDGAFGPTQACIVLQPRSFGTGGQLSNQMIVYLDPV
ncbi:hypothetical protein N7490_005169 [Penicillium lividum]|nr:hypothetical protein N7490_005169 [Penicillium lividum]